MAEAVSAFHFPDEAWARVIYDLVLAARDPRPSARDARRGARADLLRARRRASSSRTANVTTDQAEDRVERQARAFELLKPYLVDAAGDQAAARRRRARLGRGAAHEPPLTAAARILIPLANPRHGRRARSASVPRCSIRAPGELTALGIVEVPEGMPLSEGATRARQARRLLQRVLDFAPEGTSSTRSCASAGARRRASSRLAAEEEADLIIFGWGGQAPAGTTAATRPTVFSPTIDEVVRDVAVRHRGRQAARRHATIKRILAPVRGGPHAELALRFADALGRYLDATVDVLHVVPPGITMAVRAQAERALADVRPAAPARASGEAAAARGAERPQRDHARGREGRARGHGRHRPCPAATAPTSLLFGALPEAIAQHAQADRHRRQDPRADRRADVRRSAPRRPRRSRPPTARPRRRRSVPARVERWFAESNFHHAEFADLRRLVAAQGEAGRDDQRSSCRRSTRRRRSARSSARRDPRDDRSACRCSTSCSSSTRRRPTDPRDRRGRGRPRRPAPRRPAPLRHLPGQGRGALEVPLRDERRPRSRGPTRTSSTGTRGSSTGRSGRCSPSRACGTSRATTSGRSSRAACSRKAAAAASRSSSRGR